MRYHTQGFLDNDNYVLLVDACARTYGKRPSELLCIENDLIALDFDLTIMAKSNILRDGDKPQKELTPSEQKEKMKAQIATQYALQYKAQSQ